RSSTSEFSPRLGSRRLGLGRVRRRFGRRRPHRRRAGRSVLRRLLRLRLSSLCLWLRLSELRLWLQRLWLCPGLLRQLRLRPPVLCLCRTVLSPPLGPSAIPSPRVLALAITRSGTSAG